MRYNLHRLLLILALGLVSCRPLVSSPTLPDPPATIAITATLAPVVLPTLTPIIASSTPVGSGAAVTSTPIPATNPPAPPPTPQPTQTPAPKTATPLPTKAPSATPTKPIATKTPSATPQSTLDWAKTGTISGNIGYPSEGIPPLTIYARHIATGAIFKINSKLNQTQYQMTLPIGTFEVFAYPPQPAKPDDDSFAGAYSKFVLCGLLASCPDHSLVPVVVLIGKNTPKIDVTDWYAPPNAFPKRPSNDQPQGLILAHAALAVRALENQNMASLAALAHPIKGVRFSPYAFVKKDHVVLSATQLKTALTDKTVRQWGFADGTGDPIKLTYANYVKKFVYNRNFASAPKQAYNTRIGMGNSINNIAEFYPNAKFVEFHYPATEEGGLDWYSLRLIFELYQGQWMLVGVVHDQWTI